MGELLEQMVFFYLLWPPENPLQESTCSAGDLGLIPGSGQSPGAGHGHPHQYSCLENSMDRESWWATVHGVTKRQTGLIMFLSSERDWNQELKWGNDFRWERGQFIFRKK